jgi:F-type H+-transporting ATPase subunit delta
MSRIAYRYAKSLLELCIQRKEEDAVAKDMELLYTSIRENRELSLLLQSPVVKGDMKLKIMDKVFASNIQVVTQKFIHLMIEKGREAYLKEVAFSFADQVRAHRNQILAEVTTAVPMDDAMRKSVTEAAQSLSKNTIQLTEKINPELIGGFIVRVGDRQLDTSIAAQIKQLKREFSENEYVPGL